MRGGIGEEIELAGVQDPNTYATAILNILDDFTIERTHLKDAQAALLNILEDADLDKDWAQDAFTASLNVLSDLTDEKGQLESTQRAMLNILDDFDDLRRKAELAYGQVVREMSGRKTAEEALEISRAAEEAVRKANNLTTALNDELKRAYSDLESFSYSVAHDLRAPLRAIDGFSHILLEDHAAYLDEDARNVVGVVIANVGRMGSLIDDLLSFSRVGRGALTISDVDMTPIVRSVVDELRALEPDRRIDVSIGPIGSATCDPALIKQVWANLLANAFKFTRDRSVAHVDVRREDRPREVVYSVRDDGVGFDVKYVAKLFGVFQRLHSSAEFEGTGIGLALVKRVVQKHGGRVWAEGKPGGGARFSFALPVQEVRGDP